MTDLNRQTVFSPCRRYRYTLWREWAKHVGDLKSPPFDGELKPPGHSDWSPSPYCQFIGLNPSTADETNDDPTIRRCIAFAKAWGFGALCMTNLFAWRDTAPQKMKRAEDPVGPENDEWLLRIARGAGIRVAAWGNDGAHMLRGKRVAIAFSDAGLGLSCFRITKGRQPEHPLYQKATATLFNYPADPATASEPVTEAGHE